MKLTSKLLSLVLALSMVAGCGANGKKEKTPKDLVEEVAKGYMDASCKLDMKKTLDYIDPDSEMYQAHSEMNADELLNSMIPADVSQMLGEDNVDEIVEKVLELMSYEIEEPEINEDKATVDYVLKTPDFESIELDEEKMAADLGLDNEEAMMNVMLKILDAKDEAEAQEKLDAMTVEESTELIKKLMDEIGLIDYIVDLLAAADTTDVKGTIELENIDGKWLIVADEQ